jgi:Tfp pilus assembly protein PilF
MTLPALALVLGLAVPQAPAAQEPPVAAPSTQAAPAPGGAESAQPAIDAGLRAFRARQFSKAEIDFRRAVDADPQSAAAHFYLGYTYYKMGEPKKRMNPDKEKAAQEFAKAFELDPAFKPNWKGSGAPAAPAASSTPAKHHRSKKAAKKS